MLSLLFEQIIFLRINKNKIISLIFINFLQMRLWDEEINFLSTFF